MLSYPAIHAVSTYAETKAADDRLKACDGCVRSHFNDGYFVGPPRAVFDALIAEGTNKISCTERLLTP